MKKFLFIIFLISVPLLAQKVTVVENIAVTGESEGQFYYPTISPDGKGILFSTENRIGLWYKNLETGKTIKITDAAGAGYDPAFGNSSGEIIYRDDKFVAGKRMSSLISHNFLSGKETKIETNVRDLKIARNTQWKCYLYMKENTLKPIPNNGSLNKNQSASYSVFIENSKIILYQDGKKNILQPLGDGSYIWPSISPDGTKLLFTLAGKGTFISDLKGKVLVELGKADYPSWSPDGNWIVYMDDYDDGLKLTSSTIGIIKSDGTARYNLTEGDSKLSIYPKWGNSKGEIFYNTDNGQVRKIKLNYE